MAAGLLPVSVKKVLLEHSTFIHLHVVCGWFHTTRAELGFATETVWLPKAYSVYPLAL